MGRVFLQDHFFLILENKIDSILPQLAGFIASDDAKHIAKDNLNRLAEAIENCDFQDALEALGVWLCWDGEGDITELEVEENAYIGSAFTILAPVVCDGSFVEVELEGKFLKYSFDNGKVVEEEWEGAYPSDTKYAVLVTICDSAEGPSARVANIVINPTDATSAFYEVVKQTKRELENMPLNHEPDVFYEDHWMWIAAYKNQFGMTFPVVQVSVCEANGIVCQESP